MGDDVQVVNSPSSSPLLCKSSAERGKHNVISEITNGSRMTIIAGPWQDGGLYFVQVTGACNGYVATGQSGEMWIEKVESGSVDAPAQSTIVVSLDYSPWNMQYNFVLNTRTCAIVNGSEIIVAELQSLINWGPTLTQAAAYFFPTTPVYAGELEQFRYFVELQLKSNSNCTSVYYLVGGLYMDMSGLGNLEFGFYSSWYGVQLENLISSAEQAANPQSWFQFYDNPDDVTQRRTGRRIAGEIAAGEVLSASLVERIAEEQDLQ